MSALPLIIDTDPGVDDAGAILLAAASPELDLLAVTAVAGNVPLDAVVANAGRVLALAGLAAVPLHAGAGQPLVRRQVFGRHSALGAFGDDLVPVRPVAPRRRGAVEALVDAAIGGVERGRPVTICALGPLTNLALALVQDARVAAGIARIVVMGGALSALGNRAPWADFNMLADPHAAASVVRAGVPLTLLPLEATFQALLTEADLQRLEREGALPARVFARLFRASDRGDPVRFGRPGGPVHDALTVAWLLWPELFRTRDAAIGVATAGEVQGHLHADFHGVGDRPVNASVVRVVDERPLLDRLIARLCALPDPAGALEAVAS
ncbi:MAG: nucleoside hydrolase [Azospirillaceae bacterium]